MKYMFNMLMLFVASSSLVGCAVINPGEAGVVFNRLTGTLHTESQGTVFVWPFISSVRPYPVSLRTYTMVKRTDEGASKLDDSIDLPSKEGQHIRQDISITYNTTPDRASEVYRSFNGEDIEDIESTFVRRTTITVAQTSAGVMSLTELISTKRDELQNSIQQALAVELNKRGFTLDKVNLGGSHLPQAVEEQMQHKMAAQQEAQRAEYELQKQITLAKANVVYAEGVAKSNAVLQTSLTPAVLENKRIEKWNGVLPTVSTNGSGMMLNWNVKSAQ
jgi:regulator of protease activity HflC (stomatin/prohibitin superfamily)